VQMQTDLTRRLGLSHPIFQAPMAGGGDTVEMVAAAGEAGALGFIGAAYLSPQQIVEAGKSVREQSRHPFGINLFAPLPRPEVRSESVKALALVSAFCQELGVEPPKMPTFTGHAFEEQLDAVLNSGASVFSFTFGLLPQPAMESLRSHGFFILGTATHVEEAVALEKSGVDAIVAQGSEAGGHRGTFLGDVHDGMVGTISLVPQVADAVSVPVVASGGIMDGRGLAAALTLGASAVQMGTAFLACDESGISPAYREAILTARKNQTRLTRAFSGRWARGIVNRFMDEMDAAGTDAILPFPLQNQLTRPMRTAAAQQGRQEFLSLWAGQGVHMARRETVQDLIARIVREVERAT